MALYEALNNETYIKERDKWFGRLTDLFAGKNDTGKVFVLWGYDVRGTSDPLTEPEKWVDEALARIADEFAAYIMNGIRFAPSGVEYDIYGVHFIDKVFGANVFRNGDQWYSEYLKTPIGSLEMPDLDHNETFQLSVRAAKRFAEVGGRFPIFALPVIASPLNIAINLYGQDILIEMVENPEKARKDLETITDVLVKAHETFRKIVPARQLQPVGPGGRTQPSCYGQICGCSTQLVSGELYRDLLSDLDERVLGVYENGGMIHLCGAHTQHMETFRGMKKLRALQLNDRAADDFEEYFNNLRDDQIIYLNPSEKMPVERALEISGGKRLVVVSWLDHDLPIKEK